MPVLDPNRLFPMDSMVRYLARDLYESVEHLPIISPHGHTDPAWFADNAAFPDAAQLFVTPDHYVFRMLFSQGIPLDALGVPRADGTVVQTDGRTIWRLFADNYHLFRATPSRMWIDHALENVFDIKDPLNSKTADAVYDQINTALATTAFRPRSLFERFKIEVLATTDAALDPLAHHQAIKASGWIGRVVPTYRPDAIIDPETPGFQASLDTLGEMTNEDTKSWQGYLAAHRKRRAYFILNGATATDHGHPDPQTANLNTQDAATLFDRIRNGHATPDDAQLFRAQMLTEMARMSIDDGLVMQLHPGSYRNHADSIQAIHGRDKGFDIPKRVDYVHALRPLLDAFGTDPRLSLIMFTLDESSYARELAPLAGVYPALKLGPAWWFFDSPDGMRRYREATTETAGFYNTVGFNDDTRALCSIPARHDVARRVDCAYLADLVCTGRLAREDAYEVAHDLSYRLAKEAYRL